MNISEIKAKLTCKDILTIINDYVAVPALNINEVAINEFLDIFVEYSLIFNVKVKVSLAFGSIKDNQICLKILSVKVGKLPIFNFITNKVVKKIIENLKAKGILVQNSSITVDLNEILKTLPFINFKLDSLAIKKDYIEVQLFDIDFNMNKNLKTTKEVEDKTVEANEQVKIEKVVDGYTKAKGYVQDKVPDKYSMLLKYAMILPDIIALFLRLFKDKRVSLKTKLVVGSAIGYLASPLDILPDFIPFIGKIDDIAIAFFAINKIINKVPLNVIIENWEGEESIILIIKEALTYFNRITGGTNIDKIYDSLDKFI